MPMVFGGSSKYGKPNSGNAATTPTHSESAVLQTAKEIAHGLVKRPEILQVALFGKRKNKQGGYNLHLLIEVADNKLYQQFVRSLKNFAKQNATKWDPKLPDARLRLMALSTVWKDMHTLEWRTFLALNGGDIHVDVCVVMENYRKDLKQLADDIPHHNEKFIRSLAEAEVLAAKRREL